MRGGTKIGARGTGETPFGFFVHRFPSWTRGAPLRGNDPSLLDWMLRAGVIWINRFASGEALALTVIKTDAVFAKPPAQVDFLVLNHRGEIHETRVKILYQTALGVNLFERIPDLRCHAVQVVPHARGKVVVDHDAAHDLYPVADGAQVFFEVRHFPAAFHCLDQKGLY